MQCIVYEFSYATSVFPPLAPILANLTNYWVGCPPTLHDPGSFRVFNAQICILPHTKDAFFSFLTFSWLPKIPKIVWLETGESRIPCRRGRQRSGWEGPRYDLTIPKNCMELRRFWAVGDWRPWDPPLANTLFLMSQSLSSRGNLHLRKDKQ